MAKFHKRSCTIRQLEILLAVYETGSVTRASEQLHLTQPTISTQLKKLADSVGTPLWIQSGRQISFTESGKAVAKGAMEMMACIDRLDMRLQAIQGLTAGQLKLAVVTTAKYFIPHLIGQFCEQFPQIEVDFRVGNRQSIVKQVDSVDEDFWVFSHPPEHEHLETYEFLPNRLFAIGPQNHPLSQRKKIPFEEFAREPILMREPGSGTRYAIENFLKERFSQLNVRMTIESNEAIRHSVMSGLGVSILSEHTLTFGGHTGLSLLDVEGLPIHTRWYLVRNKNRPMSPVAEKLLEFVGKRNTQELTLQLEGF